ncbi:DEAD/DEAH box helicase [Actinoallomurus rhizosphaericola]|uniref:DEAD/DEAH box helicase n=1 Tax=Actinoallomurus rhizosphaericola TaxID=2952536 RepID=UPI002091CB34|nr:DEAD/DEAH box helicase [Actinoallomurus rhizosphaericola]MCO5994772.1 DEAD/DEAH box helicase [Actinoallomurus rhizosphaericola]
MRWNDRLHPSLAHHIVNSLGWHDLRPLQQEAIEPLTAGSDALLLAPTAGGKTEAASFPLLSRMALEGWDGPSVLYLAPLKALLNNLLPRLETYAGWLGRRAALWHGDVTTGARQRLLSDPPDLLLTTPESLESMLVSAKVDHRRYFSSLRAVVVDEVHAFAGDDRGWHLLAVLERLSRLAGRPLQRVGLSATVGNPRELLRWLQGASPDRPAQVVAPGVELPDRPSGHPSFTGAGPEPPPGDVQLDFVGSVDNAAKVIAALHQGEKRLVFCDSRRLVEQLGAALRMRGVTAFLSHASLSLDERRRAEHAFAESRDCVIVSTSTLELGIDVGDLDRVIQLNAPSTVASFLQRIGRTGRRGGTQRNCLFLTLNETGLLQAAGLLLLWGRHWVEPVQPPPEPRHITAQQVLALCLQEHRVGRHLWADWWGGLLAEPTKVIVDHLVTEGFLETDGGMLFIGAEAEKRFGRRHFMDLMAAFTVPPEFTVINGREEIGRTDPALLSEKVDGPRLLLLAGHSWRVTWIDWKRRRCFVEPADRGGKARWFGYGIGGQSFALSRAIRDVLLGANPPVRLTRRAESALATAREAAIDTVHPGGTVIVRSADDVRWWTWAGHRANATLLASLDGVVDRSQRAEEFSIRMRRDLDPQIWRVALSSVEERLCLPAVDEDALNGLKFNAALPRHLAEATLSSRLADIEGARLTLAAPTHFAHLS